MKNLNVLEASQEDLDFVDEFLKEGGKLAPDFFPLPVYEFAQTGYPVPTKGTMIRRLEAGTNKDRQLIDGRYSTDDEMWVKVSDVIKFLEK